MRSVVNLDEFITCSEFIKKYYIPFKGLEGFELAMRATHAGIAVAVICEAQELYDAGRINDKTQYFQKDDSKPTMYCDSSSEDYVDWTGNYNDCQDDDNYFFGEGDDFAVLEGFDVVTERQSIQQSTVEKLAGTAIGGKSDSKVFGGMVSVLAAAQVETFLSGSIAGEPALVVGKPDEQDIKVLDSLGSPMIDYAPDIEDFSYHCCDELVHHCSSRPNLFFYIKALSREDVTQTLYLFAEHACFGASLMVLFESHVFFCRKAMLVVTRESVLRLPYDGPPDGYAVIGVFKSTVVSPFSSAKTFNSFTPYVKIMWRVPGSSIARCSSFYSGKWMKFDRVGKSKIPLMNFDEFVRMTGDPCLGDRIVTHLFQKSYISDIGFGSVSLAWRATWSYGWRIPWKTFKLIFFKSLCQGFFRFDQKEKRIHYNYPLINERLTFHGDEIYIFNESIVTLRANVSHPGYKNGKCPIYLDPDKRKREFCSAPASDPCGFSEVGEKGCRGGGCCRPADAINAHLLTVPFCPYIELYAIVNDGGLGCLKRDDFDWIVFGMANSHKVVVVDHMASLTVAGMLEWVGSMHVTELSSEQKKFLLVFKIKEKFPEGVTLIDAYEFITQFDWAGVKLLQEIVNSEHLKLMGGVLY